MEPRCHEWTLEWYNGPLRVRGHYSNCHHTFTSVQICMLKQCIWQEPLLLNCMLNVGTFARSLIPLPQPIPWSRHQDSHFTEEERFTSAIGFSVIQLLKLREIRLEVPAILTPRQVCTQWWLPSDWFRLWDDVTAWARRDIVSWTVHEAGADLRKQGWIPKSYLLGDCAPVRPNYFFKSCCVAINW